ncbi:ABC transporter ATP-binding protein [Dermacoccus nishinomiyaensis]|uniref:ABC transporter ATP-binding protein n=1 Tax=Dermacoccus nishinomiyaensis TaxID=1274 RepID=UPI003B96793A
MQAPAMQLSELTKNLGSHRAVDDLMLTVPRGSMFSVVGPNGAGKTTTLSMATGLLRPDGGRVEILGHDLWRDPARAKSLIGVLPDGLRTFDRLSGRELLRHTGLLHGVDVIDVARRSDQLLDALGLDEAADKIVADYSAGMTKKIGLACALIHAPRVWARGSSSRRCPNCSRRSTPEPCDALTGASRHARDCMGTHR